MEVRKPELKDAEKRADYVHYYMKQVKRPITKQEVCGLFGWEYTPTNERRAREILQLVKSKAPVDSTSSRAGYELLTDPSDPEQIRKAEHQLNENNKRAEEIRIPNEQLIGFIERGRACRTE